MRKLSVFLSTYAFLFFGTAALISAQTTGAVNGAVVDQIGAVIPGATITVKGQSEQEYKTTSSENGTYCIPAVPNGLYTVSISANGFKSARVADVKVDVGTPATVNASLEIGDVSQIVEVVGGAEVLQTQAATVGTKMTGRQIVETPIQSRDALDLVVNLPGTNTIGTVRTSTINGLPKSALSVSIDGIDANSSLLKASDGFFTFIRPRIDAIEEVTVSSSNPGCRQRRRQRGANKVCYPPRQRRLFRRVLLAASQRQHQRQQLA
jgi:hypothetical protein